MERLVISDIHIYTYIHLHTYIYIYVYIHIYIYTCKSEAAGDYWETQERVMSHTGMRHVTRRNQFVTCLISLCDMTRSYA